MFIGQLIPANASYGCFLTMTTAADSRRVEIPENLRLAMRPCALVAPDLEQVLEMTLYNAGFSQHSVWAKKLNLFFQQLKLQLPRKPQYQMSLKRRMFVAQVSHASRSTRCDYTIGIAIF